MLMSTSPKLRQTQVAEFKKLMTIESYLTFVKKYNSTDYANKVGAAQTAIKRIEAQIGHFRQNLSAGDDSQCGLVVEVSDKLARIETMIGLKYLKRADALPKGLAECRFVNNVYQDPMI